MPEAEERISWKFERSIPNAEMREAHALEFIAYYLDRIDQHLEKIAAAGAGTQLNLSAVAHIMPQILKAVNK